MKLDSTTTYTLTMNEKEAGLLKSIIKDSRQVVPDFEEIETAFLEALKFVPETPYPFKPNPIPCPPPCPPPRDK